MSRRGGRWGLTWYGGVADDACELDQHEHRRHAQARREQQAHIQQPAPACQHQRARHGLCQTSIVWGEGVAGTEGGWKQQDALPLTEAW